MIGFPGTLRPGVRRDASITGLLGHVLSKGDATRHGGFPRCRLKFVGLNLRGSQSQIEFLYVDRLRHVLSRNLKITPRDVSVQCEVVDGAPRSDIGVDLPGNGGVGGEGDAER